jgi:Lar family restriction alleviation protein
MKKKLSKFNPCPFCGSLDVRLNSDVSMPGWPHFVLCSKCGTAGPTSLNKASAIRLWNTRKK